MTRVTVIGAGYFAQFQIEAWAAHARADLVAVADLSDAARARVAAAYPETSVVDSLEKALDLRPDLIDIATPPGTHLALIEAALAAGVRALICQKPFCATLEEARAATAAAEAVGATLAIHENFRFQPWYRAARGLIDDGTLGAVRAARFALRPGDGAGPDAYLARQPYFRTMPRFLIRETGIHFTDTFRYLFGEPTAVYADLRRVNEGIAGEDAGLVLFDLPGGGRAVFDADRTLDHPARNRRLTMGEMLIEGAAACLHLTGDGSLSLRAQGENTWAPVPVVFERDAFGGGCVAALQDHVLKGLSGESKLETEARDYLRNLELEAQIYRSAEEGIKISL